MLNIGIEEHWVSEHLQKYYPSYEGKPLDIDNFNLLTDISKKRIEAMDNAGMDFQILGHSSYPLTKVTTNEVTNANNQLAKAISKNPHRLSGFATLSFASVDDACEELKRSISILGLKGVMINGTIDGLFLDHPKFDLFLKTANDINTIIYLHPGLPPKNILKVYYNNYNDNIPMEFSRSLATVCAGWHFETGLHLMRLIGAGIFDKYHNLKIIIGHMGEMIPFYWQRITDWLIPRTKYLKQEISKYFLNNIWITTSAYTNLDILNLALKTFGQKRIFFATDYPFLPMKRSIEFLNSLPLSIDIKEDIAFKNAMHLFDLKGCIKSKQK